MTSIFNLHYRQASRSTVLTAVRSALVAVLVYTAATPPAEAGHWTRDWHINDTLVQRQFVVDVSASGEMAILASRDSVQSAKTRLLRNDASGHRRWERRVEAPDWVESVRIDEQGRTFVQMYGSLIAYDADGQELWAHDTADNPEHAPVLGSGNRLFVVSDARVLEFDRDTGFLSDLMPPSFYARGVGIDAAGGLVVWGRDVDTPSGMYRTLIFPPTGSTPPADLGAHPGFPLRNGERVPTDGRGAMLLDPGPNATTSLTWVLGDGSEETTALPVGLRAVSAWPVGASEMMVSGFADVFNGSNTQFNQHVLKLRGTVVLENRVAESASHLLSGGLLRASDGATMLTTTIADSACRNTRLRSIGANASVLWTFDLAATTGFCGTTHVLSSSGVSWIVENEEFDAHSVRVSHAGQLVGRQPIGPQVVDFSLETLRRVNMHAGGRIVVAGTAEAPSPDLNERTAQDALITSYDADGRKLWEVRSDLEHVDDANSSFTLSDDSSLLISLGLTPEQELQTTAIRIDASGNTLWSTALDELDDWAVYAPSMRQAPPDGRIVLFGSRRRPFGLGAGGVSKMAVEILSLDGELLATGGDDALYLTLTTGLAMTSDERLLVLTREEPVSGPVSYWARAFDTRDGSLLSRQQICTGFDQAACYGGFQSDADRLGMVLDYYVGGDNYIRRLEVDSHGTVHLGTPVRPDLQPFTTRATAETDQGETLLLAVGALPDTNLYLGRLSRTGGETAWQTLDVPGDAASMRLAWHRSRFAITTHDWTTAGGFTHLQSRVYVFNEQGGAAQSLTLPEVLASMGGSTQISPPRFRDDQWVLATRRFTEPALLPEIRIAAWNVPLFSAGFE